MFKFRHFILFLTFILVLWMGPVLCSVFYGLPSLVISAQFVLGVFYHLHWRCRGAGLNLRMLISFSVNSYFAEKSIVFDINNET